MSSQFVSRGTVEVYLQELNSVIGGAYEGEVCQTLWHPRAWPLQSSRTEGLNGLHHHLIPSQPSIDTDTHIPEDKY